MTERLKRLQRHYDLVPDGILGPVTLTAIERAAGLEPPRSLRVSRKSIEMIVRFEISSETHYRRELMSPIWPGGASGVTIGVGYDLGYRTWKQVERDWKRLVSCGDLDEIVDCSGLTGENAEDCLDTTELLRSVKISLEAARQVFYAVSLPEYAKRTRRAFPGVKLLPADAQGALLSLVYNRGTAMGGARRREVKQIREKCRLLLIGRILATLALTEIAAEIREMKRLWRGKNLDGLIKRREKEARLVEGSDREYGPEELVSL